MNQEFNTQTTQEVAPEKKKGGAGIIVLILVILAVLGVGGGFLATKVLNKEDKKEDTKTEEKNKEEKKEEISFSGIYESDKGTLKVYDTGKGKIFFTFDGDYSVDSYAEVKKGKAVENGFDKREFSLEGESLVVSDDSEDYNIAGVYTKKKEYTAKEYYNDAYGDPKYLESKYNGLYKSDKKKMYIYQTEDGKVRVNVDTGDYSLFDIDFDIKEDGSLYVEFFDDIYTVTFDGDKTTFTTVKTDDDDKKVKDGTYTKEKTLTIEDVIELGK